jgi:hypothetical protein
MLQTAAAIALLATSCLASGGSLGVGAMKKRASPISDEVLSLRSETLAGQTIWQNSSMVSLATQILSQPGVFL